MSIFAKAKLGEADNQILLNDFTVDPVFRTLARAATIPELRSEDLPTPFESGDSDFLTLLGATPFIISGKMYPASELAYDVGLNQLRSVASLDLNQADPDSDLGYVPYTWGDSDGDFSKQLFVKPLYCRLAETTQQGFVQPFTIICKVKDPTIFSGTLKVATTQPANFSQTTGSAVFPVAFPVVFGSTLFTVSSTAQNNGTLPAYPASIQVFGPVNVPKITNAATGEYIQVNCNLASVSDVLTLTYDKDTLSIDLGGVSQLKNLSSGSTLFKIHPGANIISLTGTSVSTNAYAVVNYYDAYPLT